MTKSETERIAVLETLVSALIEDQKATNQKLDELLALRNRGVGAFWLASALLGTGIIGALASLIEWLKG